MFPPSECIEFHLDIKGYPKSLLPNSNSSQQQQEQQQQSKGHWMDLNKAKPNECFLKLDKTLSFAWIGPFLRGKRIL